MISMEECREHLADMQLSEQQVNDLRDVIYALVENVLDEYVKGSDTIQPTCKNP
jgi:hypothetical protein